jgi:uncharacterized repeat protein (TIGR04042 family)
MNTMPEMHFLVRWPDGKEDRCYSPSLIVRDYLEAGKTYKVEEFLDRSRTMLNIASERVKAKFGYYSSAAMDQLGHIETRASEFPPEDAVVVVELQVPTGF